MAKVKITDLVEAFLGDFLEEKGLELWNVEYVKEGKDRFLRVFIDKKEGQEEKYVCIDECEMVSRYLSEKLDEADPIEQNYYLEVSSPGLDRALVSEEHYKRFSGEMVEVSLYKAFEGQKKYEGELISLENGFLSLALDKGKKEGEPKIAAIPFELVAKTRLMVIL